MSLRSATSKLAAVAVVALAAAGLAGCSAAAGDDGKTFTIWQFEDKSSANYIAWQDAVEIFKEKHPGVKVKEVTTSFDNIRKNAKLLLSGNDVPDVVEFNKGNADGGQLAAQGLLTNLNDDVASHKWDEVVTGAMQNLAKYDENGNAGPDGDWYGIPNNGQYYLVFYNKDMFDKAGIPLPTSQEELVSALDAFMKKGQVPVSANAGEFGLLQLWWQLVSNTADRKTVDDYMFLKGDTDFSSGAFASGADELQDWLQKGYLGTQLGAITQEQMKQAFIAQKFPIMMNGSWEFTSVKDSATFNWGTMAFPGANLNEGLTGQLWGIPTSAKNKDLAADWIDITLSQKVQDKIGELGGLPLRTDLDAISDPQTKEFTQSFEKLTADDKLSYFPDYPVTGLYEFLISEFQAMANGTKTAAEFNSDLQTFYDKGKKALTNG
jgi:raffinose/stachyose/melibiose transport system substrate-binding protein